MVSSILVNIDSGSSLSPVRRQVITWSNVYLLSIEPLGTNFSEIWKAMSNKHKDILITVVSLFVQQFVQTHIKERLKLGATGLCEGIPSVTGRFPSQRASNAENASILWGHYGNYF